MFLTILVTLISSSTICHISLPAHEQKTVCSLGVLNTAILVEVPCVMLIPMLLSYVL